ncbi:Hsp20/alpha crystallin family protein [Leptobacterium sp. I13]|uniref:Hsp20/alpha crystallin family protein n=1 Tax=Leptobacterium meishanense TaxID=3128904 RepID=UPI0030ED6962
MNLVKRNNKDVWFPSIIDEFLKPAWFDNSQEFGVNVPAVNIKETETDFSLELAAPGKKKEDFVIEVDDNVLTISSESKKESDEKDEEGRYTRREFSYSSFKRAFTLPETVDEEKINAGYEEGVLKVTLPKRKEALPKAKRLIDIS